MWFDATSCTSYGIRQTPLVYLVEAADDISYLIMDMEDAHKLGILSTSETESMLLSFFNEIENDAFFNYKDSVYQEVTDKNERIAFLRATVINTLVQEATRAFSIIMMRS